MELNSNMPIDRNKKREPNNRSFAGSSSEPRTTRSVTGTQFYAIPFNESNPGSIFTKDDLNLDILSKKYFDLYNQNTIKSGIIKKLSNYHTSLFGKFVLQIPLYDKLEIKNVVDLFFNYKYKKNIENNSVSGKWIHFLEIETKLDNFFNIVGSYTPTKNKLSFYIKLPINDSI